MNKLMFNPCQNLPMKKNPGNKNTTLSETQVSFKSACTGISAENSLRDASLGLIKTLLKLLTNKFNSKERSGVHDLIAVCYSEIGNYKRAVIHLKARLSLLEKPSGINSLTQGTPEWNKQRNITLDLASTHFALADCHRKLGNEKLMRYHLDEANRLTETIYPDVDTLSLHPIPANTDMHAFDAVA